MAAQLKISFRRFLLKVLTLDLTQSNKVYLFSLLSLFTTGEKVKALFDFDVEEWDEMPLKQGDIVNVLGKVDGNWWIGQVGDRIGSFPTNYVKLLSEGLL